jgi:hypothetical protein
MNFTEPSFPSLIIFNLILLFVISAHLWAVRSTRIAAGSLAWLSLICCITFTGVIAQYPMPGLMIFMMGILIVSILFALSSVGKKLSITIPIYLLVAFQGFRLPLELVLHSWAEQGTIPITMTWTGMNFDIISGIVALLSIPLVKKNKKIAWVPNIIGLALLANVIRVAILSSPVPFGWQVDPPLQLALYFPYVLIVPVCVGGALIAHLVLTRALLSLNQKPPL